MFGMQYKRPTVACGVALNLPKLIAVPKSGPTGSGFHIQKQKLSRYEHQYNSREEMQAIPRAAGHLLVPFCQSSTLSLVAGAWLCRFAHSYGFPSVQDAPDKFGSPLAPRLALNLSRFQFNRNLPQARWKDDFPHTAHQKQIALTQLTAYLLWHYAYLHSLA
jgi:hypothetical protein